LYAGSNKFWLNFHLQRSVESFKNHPSPDSAAANLRAKKILKKVPVQKYYEGLILGERTTTLTCSTKSKAPGAKLPK
jgi:hypothetical protein